MKKVLMALAAVLLICGWGCARGKTNEAGSSGTGGRVFGAVLSPDGRSLEDASVRVVVKERTPNRTSHSREERTRADGSFDIGGLRAGDLEVVVRVEGYPPTHLAPVPLAKGEVRGPLELRLREGIELSGRVFSPDGSPAAGAVVQWRETNRSVGGTRSDEQGAFELRDVPLSDLDLTVRHEQGALIEEVKARRGMEPVELLLEPGRRILGRVVDTEGSPIVGASLVLTRGSGTISFSSGLSGDFHLPFLEPGVCQLEARADGYRSIQSLTEVTVEPDEETRLEIVMAKFP